MGCGSCQEEIASLRQRVADVEAAFDELKEAYLALAKDYDRLAGEADEEEDE